MLSHPCFGGQAPYHSLKALSDSVDSVEVLSYGKHLFLMLPDFLDTNMLWVQTSLFIVYSILLITNFYMYNRKKAKRKLKMRMTTTKYRYRRNGNGNELLLHVYLT